MGMQSDKRGVKGASADDWEWIILGADDGIGVSALGEPTVQLALFIIKMEYLQ